MCSIELHHFPTGSACLFRLCVMPRSHHSIPCTILPPATALLTRVHALLSSPAPRRRTRLRPRLHVSSWSISTQHHGAAPHYPHSCAIPASISPSVHRAGHRSWRVVSSNRWRASIEHLFSMPVDHLLAHALAKDHVTPSLTPWRSLEGSSCPFPSGHSRRAPRPDNVRHVLAGHRADS
jgi:hypothetical protein